MITPEKWTALLQRMKELGISDNDLIEKFIIGSGKGGQKLQKTSSCVFLKHLPTNIEVKCSQERSREDNRFFARRKLCELFEKKFFSIKTPKEIKAEKIKKQKKKRARKRETVQDKSPS